MNQKEPVKEMVTVIIVAGGTGSRVPLPVPKQYYKIKDKPLLAYTLESFESSPVIDGIILVTGADGVGFCRDEIIARYRLRKIKEVVAGGSERQDSVYNGLLAAAPTDIVLVHDGVRPFVTEKNITDVVREAKKSGACALGVRAKDTVKICGPDMDIRETPNRETLWLAQTPQGFRFSLLLSAYEKAAAEHFPATDDAALVERMGHTVRIVPGSYENIKITTQEDLSVAEWLIEKKVREIGSFCIDASG